MAHDTGMNRFALLAVAVIAIIIAWLVFFAGPTVEPPPPVETPTVPTAPPTPTPDPAPPPTPDPAPPPAAAPEVDAGVDAEASRGPVTVDLGQHDILLAERDGRFLRLHLALVTPDEAAARVARLKRRALVRMLYFLVTKRTADSAESPGARDRLAATLEPRFRNLLRAGALDRVEVLRHEVVFKALKPPPDGGP